MTSEKSTKWSSEVRCSICNMPVEDKFTIVQQSTEGYGLYIAVGCIHDAPELNENRILGIAGSSACLAKIVHQLLKKSDTEEN